MSTQDQLVSLDRVCTLITEAIPAGWELSLSFSTDLIRLALFDPDEMSKIIRYVPLQDGILAAILEAVNRAREISLHKPISVGSIITQAEAQPPTQEPDINEGSSVC